MKPLKLDRNSQVSLFTDVEPGGVKFSWASNCFLPCWIVHFLDLQDDTADGSEIPNNHPGCMKPVVNNGINYLSTGAGVQPSTVPS